MADLLNRQSLLMRPSTSGTTGAFLQDKPEEAGKLNVGTQPLIAAPVAPVVQPATSAPVTESPEETDVPAVPSVPEVDSLEPQLSEKEQYDMDLDANLDALLAEREQAEQAKKVSTKTLMDKNLELIAKGEKPIDLDEELPWSQVAEDTFWLSARKFNQGVGWMLDLVPTGVLQGAELIDNTFFDDAIDTSKHQYVVQRAMDAHWGTVDSYKTKGATGLQAAVQEGVSDVAQALPLTVTIAGSLARYGLGQMANSGVLNQYAAPYALRLGQSLGIDVAAIAAGETAEEVVEEMAGEDSVAGVLANVGTSIFTGATIQKLKQPTDVLKQEAVNAGVKSIGSEEIDVTKSSVIRDKITQYLTNNVISKTMFKSFSEAGEDMSAFNEELRAVGKTGKVFLRHLWNKQMTDSDRSQFFANMELATQMGLKLTPYEILGNPSLRPLALATSRITPDATLKRMDENLEALDKWIAKDAPEISEAKRDLLKTSLSAHNTSIEETAAQLRKNIIIRRQELLEDLAEKEDAYDPVLIGQRFRNAVSSYVRSTKSIFSKQFDDAVAKETPVDPRVFTEELKSALNYLGKGTFSASKKAGTLVSDLAKTAMPETVDGVTKTPAITVGDLMEARNSANSALMGLDRDNPMFIQHKESLMSAVNAIDSTLGSMLPEDAQKSLKKARDDWKDNVAIKLGQKETSKLTTVDSFNQPFFNGQEMLEAVFHGSDKETRAHAYANFFKVTADNLMRFTPEESKATVVVNAAEAAKLGIKQYVVNQMISEVAMKKDLPVEEVIQAYMQRNQSVFTEILDEIDFDPGKLFRDVERGISEMQKAETDLLAKKLFLGGNEDAGVFDLKTYLQKHVLENKPEADRLVTLMNSPDEMAKLGYTKEAVQDMFASTLIRDLVGESTDGRLLDSNLKKLLDKAPSKLEEILGAERVDHMRKFLVGHQMATRFTPSEVTPRGAANLDKSMAQDLGLGMVPAFISDRMIIAKRMASAEYIMALRAIKIIGGLKSEDYKNYMTKVMSDPQFFLEAVKWSPKNYGEVKRIRLYLAAQGVDTSILNKEEARQQGENLEYLSAETEGSPYDNEETRDAVLRDAMAPKSIEVPELLQRPESQMDVSEEAMKDADANDPMHEVNQGEGPITDGMTADEATRTKALFKFQELRSSGVTKDQVLKIMEASGMAENNNKSVLMKALDEAYDPGE